MTYKTTLLMTEFVTHDVKRFILEKPDGFSFEPGQGVELAIDRPNLLDKGRPFTPTSLTDDLVLEFTIKIYPEAHGGVTHQLNHLTPGAKLQVSDPFGTISYQGKGTFIAGGAGVTPFIAILRNLANTGSISGHSLLFSNKAPRDIICEKEFRHYLGDNCIFSCTHESSKGYDDRHFDKAFLQEKIDDFSQHFYVCGPPAFTKSIVETLSGLGADVEALVFEH